MKGRGWGSTFYSIYSLLQNLSINSKRRGKTPPGYCSFAFSALASFRMGTSGSASFQRKKKSW